MIIIIAVIIISIVYQGCLGNTLPHFLSSILCVLPLWVSFEFLVVYIYWAQTFIFQSSHLVSEWYREMKILWKYSLFCPIPKLREIFLFSGKYTFCQYSMVLKRPDVTTLLHVFWKMYYMTDIYIACCYTHFYFKWVRVNLSKGKNF